MDRRRDIMKKRLLLVIASVLLLVVTAFNLGSGDGVGSEYAKFQVQGDTAVMTGVITTRTVDDVKDLLRDNPGLKTIVMKDVPGSADDLANLEASRLIRKHGLDTHVPSDGMIASGGTDFFCAGVNRTIEEGAEVGVHSWAGDGVEDASILPIDHPEHQK